VLLKNHPGKLNFNQIAKRMQINRSKLAYHVLQLVKGGFISNEMRREKEGKHFSYYTTTDKGIKYLNVLFKVKNE
ncbi:MAG: hypothetical protein ACTSWN_00955, partial [Promethearchaeota archaeon]